MTTDRFTVSDILKNYKNQEKISCVSVYDSTMAMLADRAGIDLLLVGDSLGMTMLGYDTTVPVSMEDMLRHSAAVVRGSKKAFVVGDLPFMSYHFSEADALANATRFLQEAHVSAVKLEGGEEVAPLIKKMTRGGIPVMGHIGLLPQGVLVAGGYKVRGRNEADADQLMKDALALQEAGAFAIVLECVQRDVTAKITAALDIPTIGIGAGSDCSGQIQVMHDILGLDPDFTPRHSKKYIDLASQVQEAFKSYTKDVKSANFPADKNSYK